MAIGTPAIPASGTVASNSSSATKAVTVSLTEGDLLIVGVSGWHNAASLLSVGLAAPGLTFTLGAHLPDTYGVLASWYATVPSTGSYTITATFDDSATSGALHAVAIPGGAVKQVGTFPTAAADDATITLSDWVTGNTGLAFWACHEWQDGVRSLAPEAGWTELADTAFAGWDMQANGSVLQSVYRADSSDNTATTTGYASTTYGDQTTHGIFYELEEAEASEPEPVDVDAVLTAPEATAAGTMSASTGVTGALTAPPATMAAAVNPVTQVDAALVAPEATASAALSLSTEAQAVLSAPAAQVAGSVGLSTQVSAALTAPEAIVGSAPSEIAVNAALTAPEATLTGAVALAVTTNATLTAPAAQVAAGLVASVSVNAALTAPEATITQPPPEPVTLIPVSESLLPAPMADERWRAIETVIVRRLAALPISRVLVYLLDNVHASALPALAWQFGALGPAWRIASESQRRVLLKRAVERRRHKGTWFAVRDALEAVGYEPQLRTPQAIRRDGTVHYNGQWPHRQPAEREYWILLAVPELTPIQAADVLAIANEWGRLTATPVVFRAPSLPAPIGEWHAN